MPCVKPREIQANTRTKHKGCGATNTLLASWAPNCWCCYLPAGFVNPVKRHHFRCAVGQHVFIRAADWASGPWHSVPIRVLKLACQYVPRTGRRSFGGSRRWWLSAASAISSGMWLSLWLRRGLCCGGLWLGCAARSTSRWPGERNHHHFRVQPQCNAHSALRTEVNPSATLWRCWRPSPSIVR